jgi:predicted MPP superfamily phosphohydrolase
MHSHALVLVHLSDLHLRADELRGGEAGDADIRNELREDLRRMSGEVGSVTGVLIGGDLAYAGKDEEYDYAVTWLQGVCEVLGVPRDHVWMVPGNHDVDRSAVARSKIIQGFHKAFRHTPELSLEAVDDLLREYLVEDALGHTLLEPLSAYNRFALRFGCATNHDALFWERDFDLNDGSTLRLRGVNSAVISDGDDDTGVNRLVLGSRQATMPRKQGLAYMVMCHHPPSDWLLNRDEVEDRLNSRAAIQLFGHKHRQRAWQIEKTVRIQSGALHPERNQQDWDPRYNVLAVWVDGSASGRELVVRVWPRRWNPGAQEFRPDADADGRPFWERRVELSAWERPPEAELMDPASIPMADVPGPAAEELMDLRELIYDFLNLPYQDRMEITVGLGLIRAEDRGLTEAEQEARVLRRVKEEEGMSTKLDAAIRARASRF